MKAADYADVHRMTLGITPLKVQKQIGYDVLMCVNMSDRCAQNDV